MVLNYGKSFKNYPGFLPRVLHTSKLSPGTGPYYRMEEKFSLNSETARSQTVCNGTYLREKNISKFSCCPGLVLQRTLPRRRALSSNEKKFPLS